MHIIDLGTQDYLQTWDNMKLFTNNRNHATKDELWTVQHPSVFTQGIARADKKLSNINDIAVVNTDRGGQITYHGTGQLVVYCLLDLKRLGIGVKQMVSIIELAIIDLLSSYNINAHLKDKAHGVYVDGAKIAALGLKIKNGRTYHGLSLNIDMDMSPFLLINPCGYKDLKVVQMSDFIKNKVAFNDVAIKLTQNLMNYVARNRN